MRIQIRNSTILFPLSFHCRQLPALFLHNSTVRVHFSEISLSGKAAVEQYQDEVQKNIKGFWFCFFFFLNELPMFIHCPPVQVTALGLVCKNVVF